MEPKPTPPDFPDFPFGDERGILFGTGLGCKGTTPDGGWCYTFSIKKDGLYFVKWFVDYKWGRHKGMTNSPLERCALEMAWQEAGIIEYTESRSRFIYQPHSLLIQPPLSNLRS